MAALIVRNGILGIYADSCNFILDITSEKHQHLTQPPSGVKSTLDNYLGLITYCSAVSDNGNYYAVADQKTLNIWSTRTWHLTSKILERAASKIIFTPRNDSVLVADKTGDVYVYSIDEGSPKGTRILGHLSILLDILLTPDSNYVITCDRDEKIRVSCYPNAYNIACFCLGHTEFVTRITLLWNTLVSCSGDGTVKYWSYLTGDELHSYDVAEDLRHADLDQYLITNIATIRLQDIAVICLSVHKYDGVLVYKCSSDRDQIRMEFVQNIVCKEPLNIASDDTSLWILTNSESSLLSVWSWNTTNRVFQGTSNPREINAVNTVNRECPQLANASYVDLSILYKKYQMKEEKRKKIKLDL